MTTTDDVLAPAAQAHRDAGMTEAEARDLIAPRAGTIRGKVLRLIVGMGDLGLTATEAQQVYGIVHRPIGLYSIAPRLTELLHGGYVVVGDPRSPSPGTPRRQSYVATDAGRAWVLANHHLTP